MTMVVLSVIDIVLLIAGLAGYLYVVGSQLTRVATNLEECRDLVREIVGNAEPIVPGVAHINRTGGVVAGALPLLYGMAEGIVAGVTPPAEAPPEPAPGDAPGAGPGWSPPPIGSYDRERWVLRAIPAAGERRAQLGQAVRAALRCVTASVTYG